MVRCQCACWTLIRLIFFLHRNYSYSQQRTPRTTHTCMCTNNHSTGLHAQWAERWFCWLHSNIFLACSRHMIGNSTELGSWWLPQLPRVWAKWCKMSWERSSSMCYMRDFTCPYWSNMQSLITPLFLDPYPHVRYAVCQCMFVFFNVHPYHQKTHLFYQRTAVHRFRWGDSSTIPPAKLCCAYPYTWGPWTQVPFYSFWQPPASLTISQSTHACSCGTDQLLWRCWTWHTVTLPRPNCQAAAQATESLTGWEPANKAVCARTGHHNTCHGRRCQQNHLC